MEAFPAPEVEEGQGPGLISVLHISGTQESDFTTGFNCSARNRLGEGRIQIRLGRRGELLTQRPLNLSIPNPTNAVVPKTEATKL